METKSIDFDSYTKIVRVEGLREIFTQVGGVFLAEMIMEEIEPHLGVWRKTPADPVMIEEKKAIAEPLEKIIPALFDTYYVKEVLPNTEINGTAVYNFAVGIDFNKAKDVVISFIKFISEKQEITPKNLVEKEEIKARIIKAWPNIVRALKAMEMDYRTYICRETRFTIKNRATVNINLAEFMMVLKKIVPEEEMTLEEKVEFERVVEGLKNINIVMRANIRYNDHNAVPAIVPPAEYEVIEPILLPIHP